MIYLHDGLFDGFLTCIYEHYYTQKAIAIYAEENYSPRLFDEPIFIKTDPEKAGKVCRAIFEKLSEEIYHDIFYTFLSNDVNKDCYLLEYLVTAFKVGRSIHLLHTQKCTYPIKKLSFAVSGERHRFLGLLRFSQVGEYLYAPFEPDHNILLSLGDHFADRLKQEKFIIHDKKRKKAIFCNQGKWFLSDFDLKEELVYSENELLFQELWRSYFDSVAIESRKNSKLQQQFVPLKYRSNLIEFKKIAP